MAVPSEALVHCVHWLDFSLEHGRVFLRRCFLSGLFCMSWKTLWRADLHSRCSTESVSCDLKQISWLIPQWVLVSRKEKELYYHLLLCTITSSCSYSSNNSKNCHHHHYLLLLPQGISSKGFKITLCFPRASLTFSSYFCVILILWSVSVDIVIICQPNLKFVNRYFANWIVIKCQIFWPSSLVVYWGWSPSPPCRILCCWRTQGTTFQSPPSCWFQNVFPEKLLGLTSSISHTGGPYRCPLVSLVWSVLIQFITSVSSLSFHQNVDQCNSFNLLCLLSLISSSVLPRAVGRDG